MSLSHPLTTPPTLPAIVADYFRAENHQDIEAVAQCFAPHGVVRDDGKVLTGHAEIRAWKEDSSKKYSATIVPTAADGNDGACVVMTSVSGNFPGSPLAMRFAFALADGRIDTLEISA